MAGHASAAGLAIEGNLEEDETDRDATNTTLPVHDWLTRRGELAEFAPGLFQRTKKGN
jgi:hypothetical protein